MSVELDPRVRRFQQIRAQERARAIARKEALGRIKAVNPKLNDKQAGQIYEAHLRQQRAQVINVQGRRVKVFHA